VRGVFRVTGFYDKHPSSSPPGTRITGATPGTQLTVLIDPGDRSRVAIDTTGLRASPVRPGGTG
jgi:hypothetical protein